MVLKTDAIVSGIHFFAEDPGERGVAQKALRVNLSDLAAKGAKPLGFLVSLALPKDIGDAWLTGFASGLREDAASLQMPAVRRRHRAFAGAGGGVGRDLRQRAERNGMVRRSTARVGDRVFVTGTIGDAVLGLGLRQGASSHSEGYKQREHLLSRYLLPRPRNALAQAVLDYASAAMDVSDGLAGELVKLCRVSKVSADIDVARVPLSDAARAVIAQGPVAARAGFVRRRRLRNPLHRAARQHRPLSASRLMAAQNRGHRHRRLSLTVRAPGFAAPTARRSPSNTPGFSHF